MNVVRPFARSLRGLLHAPAFSVPAFVCLALTIGAVTAVFAVVDTVLLRSLPYSEPDRLVSVYATLEQSGDDQYLMSAANTDVVAEETSVFESLASSSTGAVGLTGDGEPVRLNAAWVTPAFFRTLGATPFHGSGFEALAEAGTRVAYIGEGLWRQQFGADPDVVGDRLSVDGAPTTIAGIVPAPQVLPVATQIWLPLLLHELPRDQIHSGGYAVVGRLRADATETALEQELERITTELRYRYPRHNRSRTIAAQPLRETIVGDRSDLLVVVLSAVGLLFVLGCANVANLVLVRNARRRVAVATRMALGGSRGAILRWLAGETLLLGTLAAATGTALACLVAPALLRLTEISGPGMERAAVLSPRTLGVTVVVALAASLGVGLLPAAGLSVGDLARTLRDGRTGAGRGSRRSQGLLVGAQAAMGIVLVVVAGQTLGQLWSLSRVEPGFRTDGVVTLRIVAPEPRYPERSQFRQLFVDVRRALESVPGVATVGSTSTLPIGDPGTRFSLSVEDLPPEDPNHVEISRGRLVLPGYFEAMGIELRAGRPIRATDTADAETVVVVSEAFASTYWPGESPLGKRIKRRTYASEFPWITVVGVVEDVRDDGLQAPIAPTMYLPHWQTDTSIGRYATFVVRSERPLEQLVPELRARISEIDPQLPIARVATVGELIADSIATRRLSSGLLGLFAVIGLVLLATGTYGVVAFVVTERRSELGIRRALGAEDRSLIGLIVRVNLGYLTAGIAVGIGAGVAVTRLLQTPLVPTPSPPLYAAAAAILLLVGLGASVQPARRALQLDPTTSIREGAR